MTVTPADEPEPVEWKRLKQSPAKPEHERTMTDKEAEPFWSEDDVERGARDLGERLASHYSASFSYQQGGPITVILYNSPSIDMRALFKAALENVTPMIERIRREAREKALREIVELVGSYESENEGKSNDPLMTKAESMFYSGCCDEDRDIVDAILALIDKEPAE